MSLQMYSKSFLRSTGCIGKVPLMGSFPSSTQRHSQRLDGCISRAALRQLAIDAPYTFKTELKIRHECLGIFIHDLLGAHAARDEALHIAEQNRLLACADIVQARADVHRTL